MKTFTQIPVETSTDAMYDIDRKQASEILECSMRSVDRYIKRKWLNARKNNGNVWLNKDEVLRLRDQNFPLRKWPGISHAANISTVRHENEIPEGTIVQPEEENTVMDAPIVKEKESNAIVPKGHFALYERLLEKLRIDSKEREMRLTEAHFKIGQLEEKLSNSLPVSEIQSKEAILKSQEEAIQNKLQAERLNKYVYLSLLFGILLLQPIFWYLLKLNV